MKTNLVVLIRLNICGFGDDETESGNHFFMGLRTVENLTNGSVEKR